MILLFKIVILSSLIKILSISKSPVMCAGIYTFVMAFFSLIFGVALLKLLLLATIAFGLSFGYFWILNKLEDGFLYYFTMIAGLAIGLV